MFERYTEKARRVIFFARYEASQYGSPFIETEHLLLGLLRESRAFMKRFFGETNFEPEIRREIERHISPRERISTSVEVPLTEESKKVLKFAVEEADRNGHRHVGTEHLLLAMLGMEGSRAGQILLAKGLKAAEIREQLAKTPDSENVRIEPKEAMFERYTEKARRVIFFARFEASRYGSRYIESEHLLLGLLREGPGSVKWFPGEHNVEGEIRAEIERRITRGEPISTSVEVPLTVECRKILELAAEASERLGHRTVEMEHLLIGILRVEESMAAQILLARGMKSTSVQEQLAKESTSEYRAAAKLSASLTLERFLAGLRCQNCDALISFFAKNVVFIDAVGKRWVLEEIRKHVDTLFAPYAKKNAAYIVEDTLTDTNDSFVVVVYGRTPSSQAWSASGCTG